MICVSLAIGFRVEASGAYGLVGLRASTLNPIPYTAYTLCPIPNTQNPINPKPGNLLLTTWAGHCYRAALRAAAGREPYLRAEA